MRSKSLKEQVIWYDRYRLSLLELLIALGKGAAACALLSYTFYRSRKAFLMMLPFALLMPFYERRRLRDERKRRLSEQFKESMVILASSLSAGYSIENALVTSKQELAVLYGEHSLIAREFASITQQIRVNRPAEQALEDFALRSGLEDVRNFAEVFAVAKRSGGDLSAIMRHTAEVIRDKMQVKEEIRAMPAASQFEQKIMNGIPFFLVFYIEGSSPGFFDQMYGTNLGRVLMSSCMAAYLTALVVAKKILDIEV
ncbi:MAG: type II secretion system F family protein [Clostridiales bacterium]|nr:type II secretion system F family protein [Clostridiales bacterium]